MADKELVELIGANIVLDDESEEDFWLGMNMLLDPETFEDLF